MKLKLPRIKLALSLLSLFVLVSFTQDTYSKYLTETRGDALMAIARWKININNQDITASNYMTNVIRPVIIPSRHVQDGKLAPRSTGYFDLYLDYTNVETSFKYIITTSIPNNSGVTDLKVTGYSENGGEIVTVNNQLENLTGDVLKDDSQRTKVLRIYVVWEDSETETMNNQKDTEATLQNKKAILNTLINFKQITD